MTCTKMAKCCDKCGGQLERGFINKRDSGDVTVIKFGLVCRPCHRVFSDDGICGGQIVDVPSRENGRRVLDQVCIKCGERFGLSQIEFPAVTENVFKFLEDSNQLSLF
jgi:hypothetical protein